ncbi:MAG: BON domain-containing protein [Nitrosomonas sp.]|nr:BON domain-containing protein [Nitrosomonas sp.]
MNIKNKFIVLTISFAVSLSSAAYGQEKHQEHQTKPDTSVGTEINDSVITTKVKSALLKDTGLESLDIKVETRKGEVQLSGFVHSQSQIDRAVMIAQKVEGVKQVDNKIDIETKDASVGDKINDGVITTKVKASLFSDSIIESSDISVVTRDGEIQLSGFVDNQAQMDRAFELAGKVAGVKRVLNEMSIKK